MFNPVATYRLQFHKEFTFDEFERIIPYLQKLGVTTIYASPIFEATPGSTHGYDGVNPHNINPEIGTLEQLKKLGKKLQKQGLGWLQDIVPNHMAFHANNVWLMDVLEKGPQSAYASFFDEAWSTSLFKGQMMVPFLGAPLKEVIAKKEIKVAYNEQRLVFSYYDNIYPLRLRSYETILKINEQQPSQAIQQLLDQIEQLRKIEEPKAYTERWSELRLQLASLMNDETTKAYIDQCLQIINNDPEKLMEIADQQVYRLCHWQETDRRINFRRFFTVNGLIGLNIQHEEVFQHYHKMIKLLLEEGIFQGLRIDHIDGLYNPSGYLEQLRDLAGDDTYIVVEKILEPGEGLPCEWPIQGNTGYDFVSIVNNLFTQKSSEEAFTQFYQNLTGDTTSIHQQLHDKKALILYEYMKGELKNLHRLFMDSNLADENALSKVDANDMKAAIGEFLIQCPVYRYYGNCLPLREDEGAAILNILNRIRKSKAELTAAVDLLEDALLIKPYDGDAAYNKGALRFYQRCMQFTGPLMAKGVEDTLMYTYNRFIAHNEVGDSPETFGISIDEFHQLMQERQKTWPLSMNATSTHDTKRGEDVRARLNVLTDVADEWLQVVQEWKSLNENLKQAGAPDANEEYFIYQTLVGAYPMPGEDENNFSDRMQEYLQKALREAKTHSNWTTPDSPYEEAVKDFAVRLLDKNTSFWKSFEAFQQKIADFGIVNSLSQVLLKFTSPGVPDVYQGTELWDLSLVDPDNRRPVDYRQRYELLSVMDEKGTEDAAALLQELWQTRHNAQIKLWLVHTLFNLRRQQRKLFSKGQYLPLQVEGAYKDYVLAFARHYKEQWCIVTLPVHLAQLCKQQDKQLLELDWKDTRILLPEEAPAEWDHFFLNVRDKHNKEIAVQHLFKSVPFAILKGKQTINERAAGVLLHITSLPSPFGIGDMGPNAKLFADFLHRSHQKYWQLLPLNPTEQGQGHSPYSAISSRAGNPLLISPELLVEDGLLNAEELQPYHLPLESTTDYAGAERLKKELFQKAYDAFKKDISCTLHQPFQQFCKKEKAWLHDFALYMVLKKQHSGKAWFQWPEEHKLRQSEALQELGTQHADELEKIKWLQFIFDKQWKSLKTYCNERNIQLFGDLPFYVSYDSADVWSNKELFALDEEGNITGAAGVPPDAFSEDGQLWGMPVFKWDVLKEQNYKWWIERLRKNIELFDLIRLDHFRAFADYWEVPAGEQTAKNGEWKLGPSAHFFKAVYKKFGELPFVAEDLGEINDAVHELRDEFHLPGMKILQFAFSDNMPVNPYIPHNYTRNFIAYTGTHDNNTVKGWYRQDADESTRTRLNQYTASQVTEQNIGWVMSRLAYASVAKTAILPLQDLIGLDESARMNKPASGENNWAWRLLPQQLTSEIENRLQEWTWLFNRR